MASSVTAMSLYEKYAQLNHQLDETRETRVSLQKRVDDTRERLQHYETQVKPALLESTVKTNEETVHWQAQVDKDLQALSDLQSQRDDLVRTRDRLEQESAARREKHRMQCRSFLTESQTFRQRQCPQVHLQLSMLFGDASSLVPVDKVTRLRAVALANGWDAGRLPEEALEGDTIPAKSCQYEELKVSSTEEVDWDFLDTAFAEEENDDDDDIRKKLAEFKEQRRLFDASKHDLNKAEERLAHEVEDKYQASLRRKQQFVDKLRSVTKEVQQLEVDISVTLAAQDMAAEYDEVNLSQQSVTTQAPRGSRNRVSFSPTEEGVVNPYERRTSQQTSGESRRTESTSQTRPTEPRATTVVAQPVSLHRSRYSNSRKRKSAFGSSMEIGGAEAPRVDPPASSTPSYSRADILGAMDDEDDDDELLNFSPFGRKKT